eukprot:GFUD01044105.1.p1 GENE.GFUD01044105.1~~GFUD01044105.1.p1  ORF type:complete len:130 (+),score=39.72 GFUD01044105.1:683-1072(+)
MLPMFKTVRSIWPQVKSRNIYIQCPVFCKEESGKPLGGPPSLLKRSKLSPEARVRAMLENASDDVNDADKEKETHESKGNEFPNKPEPASEKDIDGKKPSLPWKFGRRRSLSPMSRVQGMMEDQDKSEK